MLNKRLTILTRSRAAAGERGRGSGEPTFATAATVWASVKWTRGSRPLQEGALEAYDVVMVRMRWNGVVNRDCRLACDGKTYQIIQMSEDKQDNQIQIIAQEIRQ